MNKLVASVAYAHVSSEAKVAVLPRAGGGSAGAGGSGERSGDVKRRQEDVKMAAIDRLYKKLYGSSGNFMGEHSSTLSRGHASTQQYAVVKV